MPNPVELTRQFLHDTGGWKEMKPARALHAAGKVESARYEGGVLEGLVRDGSKTFKVRAEIRSRTDVENFCNCYLARRDGIICAHLLATGLEVIEPTSSMSQASPAPSRGRPEPKPNAGKKSLSCDWPKAVEASTDASVPARLRVVLPPSLENSWEKGAIGLGIEVELGGERKLLASLPRETELFFDSSDLLLYRALQSISPEVVPGMMKLDRDDLARLVRAGVGHAGFSIGRKTELKISHAAHRPRLRRIGGLRFRADWDGAGIALVSDAGTWFWEGGNRLLPVAPGLPSRLVPLLKSGLTLEPAEFVRDWPSLSQHFETADLAIISEQPEVMLTLEGSLNHLEAKLSFRYGESLEAATTERESVFERGDELVLVDVEFERAAEEQLLGAGFARRGEAGKFVLKQKEAILQFLAFGYPEFQRTWNLETGERFAHALEQVEPIEPVLQFTGSGEDWFAMELEFESAANSSISREEVRRMLQSGQTSRPVGGGRVAVLSPERVAAIDEAISDCEPAQHSPGTYEIGQHQTGYLAALSEDLGLQTSGAVPWQRAVQGIEFYPLSETLDSLLRPYQSIGVEWMQDLASRGMGGVLADDMGLGKTIQTLSFLYSIGGSSLVVCPSSLVSNWVAEAEKFIPEVSVVALEGPDRKSVYESNPDAGIYVTSYALLRRDLDRYRNREFDALILDEAQQIKNPDSQIAKAAHSLRGSFRFALTGTPVENSVRDLWSITQFALPGYLGDRKRFAERFEKPLSAKQVPDGLRERLSRRLRPIILRRLKSEVARDLPEKIEQVVTCDLLPKQRAIYDTILRESRERILDAEGAPKRMLALTALLRLRQACCDLRLLGLQDLEPEAASIKSGVLAEVLESAIEGEHRVLVFSQFVEMLQLLVPQLAERGVDFCYLDGSTKNRAEVVQRFQEGKAPVFLISLKAGGVGLNLTAADTVIHVDPWWNPAVEAQATDRAHRIGQTRVVTAYKLITRGTVEEKILALQERKRELTESLLSASGDAGLSEEELLGLFS